MAIFNHHAPVKTFQMRKNHCPHLSEETKLMIHERNTLQKEASKDGDRFFMEEFKNKLKETKKGNMKDLSDKTNSTDAWRAARRILGMTKNLKPTSIKVRLQKWLDQTGSLFHLLV